mgnify:CR=1 FL=1
MRTSRDYTVRSQSLLLVCLLLTSILIGFSQSPNVEAESARATGSETLGVNVLSDYYDRGTNMTLAVTSLYLDQDTEYSLEYTLCRATGTWDDDTNSMDFYCSEQIDQVSSSIDIGSGNLFASTVISIEDPGLSALDAFSNGTMMFLVSITSQNIIISSFYSNAFVLGSEIQSINLGVSNEDILLGMDYDIHASFDLGFNNYYILSYTVNCSLLDANDDSNDITLLSWTGDEEIVDPYFSLEPTVLGDYRPHCSLIRDFDGTVMGSQTGSVFTVLEANYTGLESLAGATDSDYYEHNSTVTLTVDADNLFIGTEYTIVYTMCDSYAYWAPGYVFTCGSDVRYGLSDDPATTNIDESEVIEVTGEVVFTPTSSSHSEQITVPIPGCCGDDVESYPNFGTLSVDSLANNSLNFEISLKAYNVTLVTELVDSFILGGEVVSESITYERNTILIGMDSLTKTNWFFDHNNRFVLSYTVSCDLINSTGIVVDTNSGNWNHNGRPDVNMWHQPPAAGDFHSECTLTRDFDNKLMGSHTGGSFTVLDVNYTTNEGQITTTDAIFYPYDSTIELSILTTDMYPGTTYTVEYELCKLATDYENEVFTTFCDVRPWSYGQNIVESLTSGSVDFTPTSSTHTEIITIHVPMCCGDYANSVSWWMENASMTFESLLRIQGVELSNSQDESNYFTLGGEVASSNMLYQSNQILLNMNLNIDMLWELDHRNEFILTYEEECKFIDLATLTVLDTTSSLWNHRPAQINTLNSVFTSPAEGEYFVECTLTRMVDSMLMANHTSDVITVLPEIGNQDDATITASKIVKPEGWARILITMAQLDAGQSYSLGWNVMDASAAATAPVHMVSGDFTWVEGSDSVEQLYLDFNDLDDSTNACFSVSLYAAGDLLDSVNGLAFNSNLCWDQNSISDKDSDGVYDKNDQCPDTPYSSIVQVDGCSDSDLDGWDDSVEIDCNSDFQNPTSVPADFDNDGICDQLDDDDDDDGFDDLVEILRGTNPYDVTDTPTNQLPVCSIYYTLEIDGIPIDFSGEAIISTLVIGTSSVPGAGTGISPIITIPSGSYYVIAVCEDPDNDPIVLTVNEITVGPIVGQVVAGAMITLAPDVNETINAVITWTDGTNTATTIVTVNLLNTPSSNSSTPGFSMVISVLSLLGAAVLIRTPKEEL